MTTAATTLLNLIIEIKGFRGEDAREKKGTMEAYWLPGVNALGDYGRWAFAELTEFFGFEDRFQELVNGFQNETELVAAQWLADAGGSAPDLEDIPRRRGGFLV